MKSVDRFSRRSCKDHGVERTRSRGCEEVARVAQGGGWGLLTNARDMVLLGNAMFAEHATARQAWQSSALGYAFHKKTPALCFYAGKHSWMWTQEFSLPCS